MAEIKERIERLKEAMDLVDKAQQIVDEVIEESQRAHYEVYGRYGFDQLMGNGNPYNKGIHSLIEELEEEERNE